MNDLDKFFANHNFTDIEPELVSVCCTAKPYGELFRNVGRCSDCLEMTDFIKLKEA